MRLNFSMLSQPRPTTAGQAGTPGTRAFMRVPASPHANKTTGQSGTRRELQTRSVRGPSGVPGSPGHSQPAGTCKPSVHAVSPESPLVPAGITRAAIGKAIDAEAFDERVAILEFDGGLPHHKAERLAAESLTQRSLEPETQEGHVRKRWPGRSNLKKPPMQKEKNRA